MPFLLFPERFCLFFLARLRSIEKKLRKSHMKVILRNRLSPGASLPTYQLMLADFVGAQADRFADFIGEQREK